MKFWKAAPILCGLLISCLCSRVAFAHATQSHTVRGVVIAIDGTVVPEFSVVVKPVNAKPQLFERKHFKNGEFTIEDLKGDKYQLQISAKSYIPAKLEVDFKSKMPSPLQHSIVILHTYRNERRLAPGAAYSVSLRKLQEKVPDGARQTYEKAVELHRDGKLEEAMVEYGKALRTYPTYVEALSDLSTIYLLYNRPESALMFLRRAQEVDDTNPVINMNVAIALTEQADYSSAMKLLNKILHDDPKVALAHFYIGKIHYTQKKYGEAQEAARKAVEIDPQLLDAWLLLINASTEEKKYDDAKDALTHVRQMINNGKVAAFIDEQLSMLGS
jgi:tetratricopeptide (TPR) repeat protein